MDFSSGIQGFQNAFDMVKEKTFLDDPLHVQARKDINILCNKINYSALKNVDYMTIRNEHVNYVADFLVLGLNSTSKHISFPKKLFDTNNDNLYLAVIFYSNGSPVDAFVFKATDFKKTGMFSMYKYNKSQDTYSLSINPEKLKQYSFGYVLKNIKLGEKK